MSESFKRREFLKYVSLTGLSLAISDPIKASHRLFQDNKTEIQNEFFTLSFDEKNGRFNIKQTNGNFSITNSTVRANTPRGKISISQSNYKHSLEQIVVSDRLGSGKRLIIYSKDLDGDLDFETHLTLYDKWNAVIVETACKNVSSSDLITLQH